VPACAAPLALALPATTGISWRFIGGRILYSIGRTITYVCSGWWRVLQEGYFACRCAAGRQHWHGCAHPLCHWSSQWCSGVFLPGLHFPEESPRPSPMHFRALMKRSSCRSPPHRPAERLLPCGFVYLGLAAAVTLGDVGRATMLWRGLGWERFPYVGNRDCWKTGAGTCTQEASSMWSRCLRRCSLSCSSCGPQTSAYRFVSRV